MYLSSSSQSYKGKYIKYKNKYQNLKSYLGGECELLPNPEEIDYISNENLLDLCPEERITIQNKCYEINSLYRWIINRNNEILPGLMKSITYEEKKRLIQAYEELQIHDFKMYINKNTIKTKNLKKNLNVYTFNVPRDDFNDVLYMIIDAIKLFQPNPEIYGRSDMPMYYREHPEQYPEYKQNIISYVKFNLSENNVMLPINNVMLPILEIFDYVRWSGRYRQLENLADIMSNDIVNKLGFDGLGRKYSGEIYFYRTESMK